MQSTYLIANSAEASLSANSVPSLNNAPSQSRVVPLSQRRKTHWRKRAVKSIAIIGAIILGLLFNHNFGYAQALNRAGFDGNNAELIWESVNFNGQDFVVVLTRNANDEPVFVRLEYTRLHPRASLVNVLRGWNVQDQSATPDADGRLNWGWFEDRFVGEGVAWETSPVVDGQRFGSWHQLMHGNDAIGSIDEIGDQLPNRVSARIYQSGPDWTLHIVGLPGSTTQDLNEIEARLIGLGAIPPR